MTIRRATHRDAALVGAISQSAYLGYESELGFVPYPSVEDYGPRIDRGEVWLLERHGELVGLVVLEEKPDHVLIYSVAVRPDQQHRGCGRELLSFAERRALEIGASEIRLFTNDRMTRNLTVYERWGFARTGTRPHPSRPGLMLVDMAKPLATPTPSGAGGRPA